MTIGNTGAINPYDQWTPEVPASKTNKSGADLNSDTFLKLLVAQLKYQDPTSAQSPTEFMTQTAQFSSLEAMQNIEKTLSKSVLATNQAGATSMLGQKVTGKPTNASSDEVTGVVTSIAFGIDGPVLKVDGYEIPYANVKALDSKGASS